MPNMDVNSAFNNCSAASPNASGHACPKCKEPRPIQGCSEFRRHIIEHYIRYHCPDCNEHYTRETTLRAHHGKEHSRSDGSSVRDGLSQHLKVQCDTCGCCFSRCNLPTKLAEHVYDHIKSLGQLPPCFFKNFTQGQPIETPLSLDSSSPIFSGSGSYPTSLASQMPYLSMSASYHHAGHRTPSGVPPNSGQGLEDQYSANASSTLPASSPLQQLAGQGGAPYFQGYSGNSQSASPYAITSLDTLPMTESLNYLALSFTNRSQPRLANTSASSPPFVPYAYEDAMPNNNTQYPYPGTVANRGDNTYDDTHMLLSADLGG